MSWKEWLGKLTSNQVEELRRALGEEFEGVRIVRSPVEDYLYANSPPYADVFKLMPLYEGLLFHRNLLIKGPKGDGKSLSVIAYAAATKTPLITLPCGEETRRKDLYGSFFLQGKESPFLLGSVTTAIDIANEVGRAILMFEEVNALTPQTQKQLNEFLDFRKTVSIPQIGKTYRLDYPRVALGVVGLMNPSVYGGTYELNEDFRSRWIEVDLGYPERSQELEILKVNIPPPHGWPVENYTDVLNKCVNLAGQTREKNSGFNYQLSTRDVVSLAGLIFSIGIEQSLQLLSHKFEGKDHELIATRISSTFTGTPKVKEKWNSAKAAI
jgi:hypothetical protein